MIEGDPTLTAQFRHEANPWSGGVEFRVSDDTGTQVAYELASGSTSTTSSVTVTGLPAGDYTWRARSYDDYAVSGDSSTRSFTIDGDPATPDLVSPADGAAFGSTPTALKTRYNHPLDQQGTVFMQLQRQDDSGAWVQVADYRSGVKNDGQGAWWNFPPAGDAGSYRWRARGEETTGSDVSPWTAWRGFTTDGDGIGDRKAYTFEEFGLNDRMSLQVNVSSGNALLSATDLRVAGTGLDLSVTRFYNSLSSSDDNLGSGWQLGIGHAVRLDVDGTTAVFHAPTGYTTELEDDGSGTYRAADTPGLDATLEQDGTQWVLEWRDKQVYRFDGAGRWIEHQDANGNAIQLGYDTSGRLQTTTDTRGRDVVFAYDNDLLDTVTEWDGDHTDPASSSIRTFSYAYDSQGRLETSAVTGYALDPSDGNLNQTTSYGYDADGRLTTITDPRGATTTIGYDGYSRKVATVTRSATTNPHGTGGGTAAAPTRFFYDTTLGADCASEDASVDVDHQVRVEGPRINDTAGADPEDLFDVTTYCFDDHDRQKVTFDARGHRRSRDYTSKSNITTLNESGVAAGPGTQFDWQNDQMRGVTLPTGGTSTLDYTDSSNPFLPTSVTNYAQTLANDGQSTTPATWHYDYDDDGNLIEVRYDADRDADLATDTPNDIVYRYCYNDDGTVDRWSYDGTALSLDDNTGGSDCAAETPATATIYSYTTQGELTQIDPPTARGTTTFTYDHASRVETRTDGRGVTATYTYDAYDRTTSVVFDDGTTSETVSYSYDTNGNMTARDNASGGGTDTYVFDELNRIVKETPMAPSAATLYSYNRAGQVTDVELVDETTSPAGDLGVVSYSYDELNRLQTLDDQEGRVTDLDYDDRGNRTFLNLPNGVTQRWRYDDSDRITCLYAHTGTDPVGPGCDWTAGLVAFEAYTYGPDQTGDPDSNRLESRTDNTNDQTVYGYDDLGRLASATTGDPASPTRQHLYSYDSRANLTEEDLGGTAVVDGVRTQVYDADGALCWVDDQAYTGPTCPSPPAGAETFTYDAAGNMTGRDGLSMAYNPLGQNDQVTVGGGSPISLEYRDVTSDRRAARGDLDFDYAQTGLIAQSTTGTGDDHLFARTPGGQLIAMLDPDSSDDRYYITDRLGSTIATTDVTGALDHAYAYQPYGQQINPAAGDDNPYRYASGYHDTDTGLIKFGTRYYMPDLARWTQPDPVLGNFTQPFSLDPYQYVGADPIGRVDPSGESWSFVDDAINIYDWLDFTNDLGSIQSARDAAIVYGAWLFGGAVAFVCGAAVVAVSGGIGAFGLGGCGAAGFLAGETIEGLAS